MRLYLTLLAVIITTSSFAYLKDSTTKYSLSYKNFDKIIYGQYNYKESSYSEDRCGEYRTCFPPIQRNRSVYILETITDKSHINKFQFDKKISVYTNNSKYARPYVDYYISNNIVVQRSYHPNHHFYVPDHHHQDFSDKSYKLSSTSKIN